MLTKYTLSLFFILIISRTQGQQAWFRLDTTTVLTANGKKLLNPWAGGLNASQFSKMFLNADAIEDLVVFDRTSGSVTTFLAKEDATGKMNFIHAPYYQSFFPAFENWMILADYNKDGFKDLFVSTSLGITVYRQIRNGETWSWKLEANALYSQGFTVPINLQVSGADIPGIVDIDDDGDLDLITFDFSGSFIELHQNLSMEKYGVPDSLGTIANPVFKRNGDCWGNFSKNDTETGFVFGVDCGVKTYAGSRVLHAGNTILLHDMDGDGTKDLLVGHVSGENLSIVKNSAKGIIANFTSSLNRFPAADPVLFHIFPAAFMEDVDFDGVKDLLASTNVASNDNNLSDFRSSNWYYHNSGTSNVPKFTLVQKNFLQDQMLDVGENASPAFFDVDGDGDLDMIIGTGGIPGINGFRGALWYLKNTGTTKMPQYEVSSENYLDLPRSFDAYNFKPQWADYSGDGVPDLGFSSVSFRGLSFSYIPNKAKLGEAVQLNLQDAVAITLPSETLTGESPFFYDADGDGDLDLLVGKAQGNISYYTNTGTALKPVFKLETESFAGIPTSFEGRSVQVSIADIDLDGRADLLTVDQSGLLKIFHSGDWGKWTQRESLLMERDGKGTALKFGKYLSVAAGDYTGDGKPDIAIGGNLGGVQLISNILPISITGVEPEPGKRLNVYPNPAHGLINIHSSTRGLINVYSVNGVAIMQNITIGANTERELSTQTWTPGLYILELKHGEQREVKKIVVR